MVCIFWGRINWRKSVTTPAEKESVAEEVKETAKPEAEEDAKWPPKPMKKERRAGKKAKSC